MSNVLLKQLEDIQSLSNKMLSLAETGDWENLPDLGKQRDTNIRSFFEGRKITPEESDKVAQTIKAVLNINNQITCLAEQRKVVISEQLQGFKKRQNVNTAYLQNK